MPAGGAIDCVGGWSLPAFAVDGLDTVLASAVTGVRVIALVVDVKIVVVDVEMEVVVVLERVVDEIVVKVPVVVEVLERLVTLVVVRVPVVLVMVVHPPAYDTALPSQPMHT